MKSIVFALIAVILVICSCNSGGNENQSVKAEIAIDSTKYYDSVFAPLRFTIDTFFTSKQKEKLFNGCILFADHGRIIHKKAYGFKTPDEKDSLNLNDRFQLGSVSKPFTAAAILLLRKQGKLNLNDTLGKFYPGFPFKGITIELLLCHRGGLANYNYYCDDFCSNKSTPIPNDTAIALLSRHLPKPYYKPDEQFDYSNTGYVILANIVEKVSGEKFSIFMKKNIFDPLGMKNSVIYSACEEVDFENKLNGYDWKDRLIEEHYQNGVTGDKGMYSTVEDLFLFDQAIREGKLLGSKGWTEAFTGKNPDRVKEGKDDYGYGWRIRTSFAGYEVVYHTGWWKGFRAYFIRNLTLQQTILITDNFKRNPFFSIEELLDLADGGTFGAAMNADSLSVSE